MEQRPTKELREWLAKEPGAISISSVLKVLDMLDRAVAERDEARRDLAISRFLRSDALREGFDAAQAWNYEEDRPKFPTWGHFKKHLAEEEEHAATLARIAEAEEKEEL